MNKCFQFKTQSVADHGRSVAKYYVDLIQHIERKKPLTHHWKLPSWVHTPCVKANLLPFHIVITYMIYHDCGKPYCHVIDDDGKSHFPDHAMVSKNIFEHVCADHTFTDDDAMVASLIGQDMDVHLLKAVGVPDFSTRQSAATLLLSGLSELHSNAEMFGGIESVGFKSKWKNLNRRGTAMVKLWNAQTPKGSDYEN